MIGPRKGHKGIQYSEAKVLLLSRKDFSTDLQTRTCKRIKQNHRRFVQNEPIEMKFKAFSFTMTMIYNTI